MVNVGTETEAEALENACGVRRSCRGKAGHLPRWGFRWKGHAASVTIFRAAKRTDRVLLIDLYTSNPFLWSRGYTASKVLALSSE